MLTLTLPTLKQFFTHPPVDLTRHRAQEHLLTQQQSIALGQAYAQQQPLSVAANLPARPTGVDAMTLYHWSNQGRLEDLKPVRAKRMSVSAFAFFRGMPSAMLFDQAWQPHSGLLQTICGDCHLSNFGGFASPERQLIFGITDFDESIVAPFEWDLKRFLTSILIAARQLNLSSKVQISTLKSVLQMYRDTLEACRALSPLQLWYHQLDSDDILALTSDRRVYQQREEEFKTVKKNNIKKLLTKLTDLNDITGHRQFKQQPPLQRHPTAQQPFATAAQINQFFAQYRVSLKFDRQVLLDRYQWSDVALRVVGVGSVGTVCAVALLEDVDREPVILQMKEARPSVLAPLLSNTPVHEGERIVHGQQLLQSASDIFLGFSQLEQAGLSPQYYYVRQLRDMKYSVDLEEMDETGFMAYLQICARALAYANAKSGNADLLASYLDACGDYASALIHYAQVAAARNEDDYQLFLQHIASGEIAVAGDDVL